MPSPILIAIEVIEVIPNVHAPEGEIFEGLFYCGDDPDQLRHYYFCNLSDPNGCRIWVTKEWVKRRWTSRNSAS